MYDPRSDYALNKLNPDAIVCKSVTGVHIRITREDFASEEEFQRWKMWYDNDLHEEEKRNHICDDNDLSLEGLAEASVVSPSAEAVIEHRARNRAKNSITPRCLSIPGRSLPKRNTDAFGFTLLMA